MIRFLREDKNTFCAQRGTEKGQILHFRLAPSNNASFHMCNMLKSVFRPKILSNFSVKVNPSSGKNNNLEPLSIQAFFFFTIWTKLSLLVILITYLTWSSRILAGSKHWFRRKKWWSLPSSLRRLCLGSDWSGSFPAGFKIKSLLHHRLPLYVLTALSTHPGTPGTTSLSRAVAFCAHPNDTLVSLSWRRKGGS